MFKDEKALGEPLKPEWPRWHKWANEPIVYPDSFEWIDYSYVVLPRSR